MNLPRLLNSIADCRTAIRLFGLTPDEADRVVIEEFKRSLDTLYPPKQPQPIPLTPREQQEQDDERDRNQCAPNDSQ